MFDSLHALLRSVRPTAALLALCALAPTSSAGSQNYFDGTFATGWMHSKVLDTTPGASATFTTSQQYGGFPVGDYQETTHTWSNGAIVVAHYLGVMWDPTQAPACTFDVSFLARHFTASTVGGAVRVRMLIFQQGTTYHEVGGFDVYTDQWWSYFTLGLTPTSFVKVDGPGPDVPDFSCSGWPLVLGYTTANSASGGPVTKVLGVDDFSITVHYARSDFVDGTFSSSPWVSTKIVDTSPGQINTFSTSMPNTGGNPNDYLSVSQTFSQGDILIAHMNTAWTQNPAVEPVYAVSAGFDANHFTDPGPPFLGAVAYRIAIQQGAAWYGGPLVNVYYLGWNHFTQNLLHAADFTLLAGTGPAHPDFTSAGAVMTFGYVTGTTYAGLTPVTKISGIDNLVVLAHTSPPCAVLTGQSMCEGTGAVGPCPCFPALPAGQPGHGCPNSVFPSGGRLVAVGSASVANDSLLLQATAMPNSSCIFFQGDAFAPQQVFDGIACVSGALIRLGTKSNVCNSSQYPESFNTKVSVRGQIPGPAVRYYQVWYRNAAASFCTSATSNYTNAVAVTWTL